MLRTEECRWWLIQLVSWSQLQVFFFSDWKLATWNTWRRGWRECWILCLLSQFYYKQTRLDFQTSSPFHSFKHEDHVYGELDFAIIIIIIVAALRHGLKRNFKRIRMWRFLLWNDLDTNWWFALTTDHRIFFFWTRIAMHRGTDFTPKILIHA